MNDRTVNIHICGKKGAGKTTLLQHIGQALRSFGYNIQPFDDGKAVRLYHEVPDARLIKLMTHETREYPMDADEQESGMLRFRPMEISNKVVAREVAYRAPTKGDPPRRGWLFAVLCHTDTGPEGGAELSMVVEDEGGHLLHLTTDAVQFVATAPDEQARPWQYLTNMSIATYSNR
ncbi:MAG: hypothetical protein H6974_11170 [Gammaproteobacteria bacterium]|nr:hypothetical protein [Gammaproteobacteria bacterium]